MQFLKPYILYSLFLLLIPIIIHLVRWRKFKHVLFTNVELLQELEIQSHKSRKLKEIIVLLLRLLAFAMLILAFAQPFFTSKASKLGIKKTKNIIYLDNSRSLSLLNGKTSIWQQYLQDLTQNTLPNKKYTLLTNEKIFNEISGKQLQKIIYKISFSNKITDHNKILKKISLLTDNQQNNVHILYLSDLQNATNQKLDDSLFVKNFQYYFYQKQTKNIANVSIDSIWQTENSNQYNKLKLKISANNAALTTQVSIKANEKILWNNTINFKDSLQQIFNIKLPKQNIDAKITVNDNGFQFDNQLYFTIHQPKKLQILVIGEKLPKFLKKIYTSDEFLLEHKQYNQLDYNNINKFHLIIINNYADTYKLSFSALNSYLKQHGKLLIFPNYHQSQALSQLLKSLQVDVQIDIDTTKVYLNKVNYDHPLFNGVFLKKVQNFFYPFVKEHYLFNKTGDWLYKLSDDSPFVQTYGVHKNIFVLNAKLDLENTNFISMPSLVVPLLYSLPFYQNSQEKLYYSLGKKNKIFIKTKLKKDEVIQLKSKKTNTTYIPLQEIQGSKIQIIAGEQIPEKAGIYTVLHKQKNINRIAFNYLRKENILNYIKLPKNLNIHSIKNLKQYNNEQENLFKEKKIWKWFLLLALLFLIIEILVIKFWK